MTQQVIIWVTIAIYVILMLAMGIINNKSSKTISSFTVGGRNAGAWISALSYGSSYFSAVMFVGYAGASGWDFGLWAILIGIGNAIFGSWLAWKVLARRVREISNRLRIQTMPRLLEIRYQSRSMKFFAATIIYIFLLPYSASVYKGLTSICSVLLNVDANISMIIIAVASAAIVILGGYMGALKADFIQGIIMMVGIALLIFFVLKSPTITGGGGISGMWDYMSNHSMAPLKPQSTIALVSTILMTSFGTWGLPQMIHKYYGIKDDREVKRGTVISTFFAVLVGGGGYLIGSFSHLFFGNTMPKGGKDFIVPNMLNQAALPSILLGVILVLLIAASVSTLSSITLTASSTLMLDLIKPKSKSGKLNEHNMAVYTKILCLLFVAASYIIATTKTPILDMMSYSWGILSGSLLAPFALSLYWKKVNKTAAWASIITGFTTAVIPALSKIIDLIAGSPQNPDGILLITKKLAALGPQFAVAAIILSLLACAAVTIISTFSKSDESYNELFYEGTIEQE